MLTIPVARSRVLWVCLLVPLFSACAHSPRPGVVQPAPAAARTDERLGAYEGQTVIAVVERLENKAHTESFDDGSVVVSNILWLGIVRPERFDTMLMVLMKGHPRIGDRPLLLGDAVRFVLPRNWRGRELTLEELEGLEFVEAGNAGKPPMRE